MKNQEKILGYFCGANPGPWTWAAAIRLPDWVDIASCHIGAGTSLTDSTTDDKMSAPQLPASTTGSRSRPQARKKVNDDAAYFGPPTTGAGAKRAMDKVDGEAAPRVKRKRVVGGGEVAANSRARDRDLDGEGRVSLVNSSVRSFIRTTI
jgi:hypothetical protein